MNSNFSCYNIFAAWYKSKTYFSDVCRRWHNLAWFKGSYGSCLGCLIKFTALENQLHHKTIEVIWMKILCYFISRYISQKTIICHVLCSPPCWYRFHQFKQHLRHSQHWYRYLNNSNFQPIGDSESVLLADSSVKKSQLVSPAGLLTALSAKKSITLVGSRSGFTTVLFKSGFADSWRSIGAANTQKSSCLTLPSVSVLLLCFYQFVLWRICDPFFC